MKTDIAKNKWKQPLNALCGIVVGATFAIANVQAGTGVTQNDMASGSGATIILADNTPVVGGNAPNPEPDRSVSTTADDAAITAKVKTKLLSDTAVGGLKIDVDTRSGVVYLTGDSMKSQSEIDQAIQIAKSTSGVKSVVSKLLVGDA